MLGSLPGPVILLNKSAEVIYCNQSAKRLFSSQSNDSRGPAFNFLAVFDEKHQPSIAVAVESALGTSKAIGFECWMSSTGSLSTGNRQIPLELTFMRQSWAEADTVLVLCQDKSESIRRHRVTSMLIEGLLPSCRYLVQEFTRKLKHSISCRKEDLIRCQRILLDITGLKLISDYFANQVEVRCQVFSLLTHLNNLIEFITAKAFRNQIGFELKETSKLPQFVSGELLIYELLLDSVIDIAVNKAEKSSNIVVKIGCIATDSFNATLEHAITFKVGSFRLDEIDELLEVGEDLSTSNLKATIARGGPCLAVFKLIVHLFPSYKIKTVAKDSCVTISFSSVVSLVSEHTITRKVTISGAAFKVSPMTTCWSAPSIEETEIALVPIAPTQDGSLQLEEQLQAVRRKIKTKSVDAKERVALRFMRKKPAELDQPYKHEVNEDSWRSIGSLLKNYDLTPVSRQCLEFVT